MTVFSQDPTVAKTQVEELAAAVTAQLAAQSETLITSTSRPSQRSIQMLLGQDLVIDPAHRIIWYDGKYMRGEYGTLRDFLAPLTASYKQIPGAVNAIRGMFWRSRTRYYMNGSYFTSTTGVYSTRVTSFYLDNMVQDFWPAAAEEVISVNHTTGMVLTVSSTNILRIGVVADSPGITTATVTNLGAARPAVAVSDNSGNIYFRDTANPNNVQKRTSGGVVSTIYTGFADLADIQWDATTNLLILFRNVSPVPASSAYTLTTAGASLTLLVPSGDYAAGHILSGWRYVGAQVKAGFLYVPVPGSRYLLTRRKYNIALATYVEEEFDFGPAKGALSEVSKEAQFIIENSQGAYTQQRAYWGAEFFAYPFERLLDALRSPDDTAWMIMYETGPLTALPGASQGWAWAVLPDNGVSGQIYPVTEQIDPRGDTFLVKELIYDVATKEMTLDWSDVDLTDFETIVISFDNGLTTATETIRVQLNGDTGAHYDLTFYRAAVAVVTNTTATAAAYWDLYGVNTTTVLGGKYHLTFVDHVYAGPNVSMILEGVTATGIASGNVNSVLGMGRWVNPAMTATPITSIRIFLSGAAAFFAAGARISVNAYRTGHTYSNLD